MLSQDSHWYQHAVIYELHVRSFCDSVGDGVGTFSGLTQKLDYLQDLGVTVLWLLPFYPSPLRDDGYDIADYTNIQPHYGTLESFREFLDAAHARGLRVITELVLNHTSDQHPWFQRARRAPPDSSARKFYVWSDLPDKYHDARIIFQDFESSNWTYDPVARAYFWHRFYAHQPDLNFDHPEVWQAIFPVVDFWMEQGVDGLRLDAVPYLYEREGTNCENLPETHTFLKALRRHIDERFPDRVLLAEANQWPEDAVAYFGQGDECQMAFHFPLMPRLFMAMHLQDRFPIIDILQQTPTIPANCQWALFLRNHDELTLEMVTDEERDYMYRAYSNDHQSRVNLGIRRRLAPLLGNNRRRIELMNGLLFSLPGTPVIYYGDEIGMGDNIYLGDRNGVRTPMQWSADRNAGFSRANSQRLFLPIIIDPEYHYEAINVEAQQGNPHSLLWWMKRLIGLRRQHRAFSRGAIEFLHPQNRKILAFVRRDEVESLLVVANLSRFVQHVELDLHAFADVTPVELFGATQFPRIGKQPYAMTLGPHAFYWFALCAPPSPDSRAARSSIAPITKTAFVPTHWEQLFEATRRPQLMELLRAFLATTATDGDARLVRTARLHDVIRVPCGEAVVYVVLVESEYYEGEAKINALPLAFATQETVATWPLNDRPPIVAEIQGGAPGVLYQATTAPDYCQALTAAMTNRQRIPGLLGGELVGWSTPERGLACGADHAQLVPVPVTIEQANTSLVFADRTILKCFRQVEHGLHPEVEFGRRLLEPTPFPQAAPLLGAIEYRERRAEPITLAVWHQFVANEGDAWQFVLDAVSDFYEHVVTLQQEAPVADFTRPAWLESEASQPPALAQELIGSFLPLVAQLGRRLGELHLVLAAPSDNRAFAPEEFTPQYQRSIYQSFRNQAHDVLFELSQVHATLSDDVRPLATDVLSREREMLICFQRLLNRRLSVIRIRSPGDWHLGQVLFTGKDFVFIDFEGLPEQSLGERRIKRSPLCDVVGMVRSFQNAALSTLYGLSTGRGRPPGVIRVEDANRLLPWARVWCEWTATAFFSAYRQTVNATRFLPPAADDRHELLSVLLLERALFELDQAISRRHLWIQLALHGVLDALALAQAQRPT